MILERLAPLEHAEGMKGLITGAPRILMNILQESEGVSCEEPL